MTTQSNQCHQRSWLLTGGSIIDADRRLLRRANVLIENGVIRQISSGTIAAPQDWFGTLHVLH